MPSHQRKLYINKERLENIAINREKGYVVVAQNIVVFGLLYRGKLMKMA